jgi:hypothetical protein
MFKAILFKAYNFSYSRVEAGRSQVPGQPGERQQDSISKTKSKQKEWEFG